LAPERQIPRGRVLNQDEISSALPLSEIGRKPIAGALWYDAVITSHQRLTMELLHWASSCGATCLNYVEATGLLSSPSSDLKVVAADLTTGDEWEYEASAVVNCAGPWCREVTNRFEEQAFQELFHPSLAFNLLLRRNAAARTALAVYPPDASGQTYFIVPVGNRILAGTSHWPSDACPETPSPTRDQVGTFLSELNRAIPGFSLGRNDIVRVHAGLLPALNPRSTKLRVRDLILNHREHGGTKGFFSISGTKLTTARALAGKVLRKICEDQNRAIPAVRNKPRPQPFQDLSLSAFRTFLNSDRSAASAYLEHFSKREATVYLEDLLLRRTGWADEIDDLAEITEEVSPLIDSGSLLEARACLRTPLSGSL